MNAEQVYSLSVCLKNSLIRRSPITDKLPLILCTACSLGLKKYRTAWRTLELWSCSTGLSRIVRSITRIRTKAFTTLDSAFRLRACTKTLTNGSGVKVRIMLGNCPQEERSSTSGKWLENISSKEAFRTPDLKLNR